MRFINFMNIRGEFEKVLYALIQPNAKKEK